MAGFSIGIDIALGAVEVDRDVLVQGNFELETGDNFLLETADYLLLEA